MKNNFLERFVDITFGKTIPQVNSMITPDTLTYAFHSQEEPITPHTSNEMLPAMDELPSMQIKNNSKPKHKEKNNHTNEHESLQTNIDKIKTSQENKNKTNKLTTKRVLDHMSTPIPTKNTMVQNKTHHENVSPQFMTNNYTKNNAAKYKTKDPVNEIQTNKILHTDIQRETNQFDVKNNPIKPSDNVKQTVEEQQKTIAKQNSATGYVNKMNRSIPEVKSSDNVSGQSEYEPESMYLEPTINDQTISFPNKYDIVSKINMAKSRYVEPIININIGRIEVHAINQKPSNEIRPSPPSPDLSLKEYLKQRYKET